MNLEILDLHCKYVIKQDYIIDHNNQIKLDVSDLNNGIYLIQIISNQEIQTGKLIIHN